MTENLEVKVLNDCCGMGALPVKHILSEKYCNRILPFNTDAYLHCPYLGCRRLVDISLDGEKMGRFEFRYLCGKK